jgi:hypothetical protein
MRERNAWRDRNFFLWQVVFHGCNKLRRHITVQHISRWSLCCRFVSISPLRMAVNTAPRPAPRMDFVQWLFKRPVAPLKVAILCSAVRRLLLLPGSFRRIRSGMLLRMLYTFSVPCLCHRRQRMPGFW